MNRGIERCPRCCVEQLAAFTNGNGQAFLECLGCGYVEPVVRKVDPSPTVYYLNADGKKRLSRANVIGYTGRMPKSA